MTEEQIQEQIRIWKEKRHAVILAHNYVEGEVQDVADSLELSIRARDSRAPVIVFCGVSFMGKTAKILSPKAVVLHPVRSAGCPMADMADGAEVAEYRRMHPDTVIVAYVNTTTAAKASVDICCTSANAEKVVRSIAGTEDFAFAGSESRSEHRPRHWKTDGIVAGFLSNPQPDSAGNDSCKPEEIS